MKIAPNDENLTRYLGEIDEYIKFRTKIPEDHPARQKFDKMIEWFKEDGKQFENVEIIHHSGSDRGVFALRNFVKDEVVIQLPLSHLVT